MLFRSRTGNPKSSSSTNGTDAGNGRTDTGLFGTEPEQRSNTAGSVAPSTQTAENDNELSKQTDTVLQTLAGNDRNPVVRVILVYADHSFEALTLHKP